MVSKMILFVSIAALMCCMMGLGHCDSSASYQPGDRIASFSLPVLPRGSIWSYDATTSDTGCSSSVIFVALDAVDGVSIAMSTSMESIDALLIEDNRNVTSEGTLMQVVFASSASSSSVARQIMIELQDRVNNRLRVHGLEDVWKGRLHYVSHSIRALEHTFIPALLSQWKSSSSRRRVRYASGTSPYSQLNGIRLDAHYDWLPGFAYIGSNYHELVKVDDSCISSRKLHGQLALVEDPVEASHYDVVKACQAAGAAGVIFTAGKGRFVHDMNCEGDECNDMLSIPATMIPAEDGEVLRKHLTQHETVKAQFYEDGADASFFAIDSDSRLQELGWILIPSYQHLVWEAEWLEYTRRLEERLARPAVLVPVFNKANIHGNGASVDVEIPAAVETASFVELDMSLECTGAEDRDCPAWDHVVNLFVCCDIEHASTMCASKCPSYAMSGDDACGEELGRYITPFRRRVGHWLTDVSSLAPLLTSKTGSGHKCRFTMRTAAWAHPWLASLQLRIGHNDPSPKTQHIPTSLIPLFRGRRFNTKYNDNREMSFQLPEGYSRVELVAVITGHGSDNNNCAEFCVTSHRFVFNGNEEGAAVDVFKDAGTLQGCANRVIEGVEPNEHGTWLYGRGGWCDGQQVDPWIVPITSLVHSGSNIISYRGLYDGDTPSPTSNAGYIMMYSHVAVYMHDDERTLVTAK